ncbi:unnamed protein product [Mytilus coruscus]|uniref:B box-type domain-containing protein n=1 Tax=Mytilus coruscus TaxID=42192 RepID=A0A6J8BPU2_MYTCO|nr:unnamed protein product [Mytilus coruscus]
MSGSQSAVLERSTEHVFCSLHIKETTFLCTECKQFICDRCVESVHARHALKSIPRTDNHILVNEMLQQQIILYKEVWQVELEEQSKAIDLHAARLVKIINKIRDSYKEEILRKKAQNKSILKEIEDESDNNIPPTLSMMQTTFTPSTIDILGIKREFGKLCVNATNVNLQPGFSWPSLFQVKNLSTEGQHGSVYRGMSSDSADENDRCDL